MLFVRLDLCPPIRLSFQGNIEAYSSSLALNETGHSYGLVRTISIFLKDASFTGSMASIDGNQLLLSHALFYCFLCYQLLRILVWYGQICFLAC